MKLIIARVLMVVSPFGWFVLSIMHAPPCKPSAVCKIMLGTYSHDKPREAIMETPEEILKRPYLRIIVPEPDGSCRAEMPGFPGCIATGETFEEAVSSLEAVATGWLTAAIALGHKIPRPNIKRSENHNDN